MSKIYKHTRRAIAPRRLIGPLRRPLSHIVIEARIGQTVLAIRSNKVICVLREYLVLSRERPVAVSMAPVPNATALLASPWLLETVGGLPVCGLAPAIGNKAGLHGGEPSDVLLGWHGSGAHCDADGLKSTSMVQQEKLLPGLTIVSQHDRICGVLRCTFLLMLLVDTSEHVFSNSM